MGPRGYESKCQRVCLEGPLAVAFDTASVEKAPEVCFPKRLLLKVPHSWFLTGHAAGPGCWEATFPDLGGLC